MRVVVFGTYDVRRHPRVGVLAEGLRDLGAEVVECNIPLDVDTAARVAAVEKPWRLVALAGRLAATWVRLWRRARRIPTPDVVVVGYLGVFDVHLADRRWPHAVLVLDQMAFVGDIARDRGIGGRRIVRWLDRIDAAAIRRADVVLVDTDENLQLIPQDMSDRGVVAPVGAPGAWFAGSPRPPGADRPLRVVFYGLYTPLQGAPVIGAAIARCGAAVSFTMIGTGQDLEATRMAAGTSDRVRWLDWVDEAGLIDIVAHHDVCLGVFGTGDKAARVGPTKVYQGAAAGCAIVTADTPPQRRALGEDAVFVAPGDADALTGALEDLAADRTRLAALQRAARLRAEKDFSPVAASRPLWAALVDRTG